MTFSFPSLLRCIAGPCVLALGLAGCAAEPKGFWTDVPKGQLERTTVSGPPVQTRAPVYKMGLNVTYLRGYIRTPFTHPPRLVDVRGMRPGTLVVCPFTQKLFYVPLDFVDARREPLLPKQYFKPVGAPVLPASVTAAMSAPVPASVPLAAPVVPRDRDLPYGTAVPGRPGFVFSPYADKTQLVDVTGLSPGMEVKCPYSGKIFRVPVK
jgi:hypothetical protein